jgi:hypothetical protein
MRTSLPLLILLLASCHENRDMSSQVPYPKYPDIRMASRSKVPVLDADGHKDSMLVFRTKETGDCIAVVAFRDQDLPDRSDLYLYRIRDSILQPIRFYYHANQFWDCLIALDNFTVVDSMHKTIYCKTMRDFGPDKAALAVVSKYVWEADAERFVLKAEKSLPLSVEEHPTSVLGDF